jgi:hypothetical protein
VSVRPCLSRPQCSAPPRLSETCVRAFALSRARCSTVCAARRASGEMRASIGSNLWLPPLTRRVCRVPRHSALRKEGEGGKLFAEEPPLSLFPCRSANRDVRCADDTTVGCAFARRKQRSEVVLTVPPAPPSFACSSFNPSRRRRRMRGCGSSAYVQRRERAQWTVRVTSPAKRELRLQQTNLSVFKTQKAFVRSSSPRQRSAAWQTRPMDHRVHSETTPLSSRASSRFAFRRADIDTRQ